MEVMAHSGYPDRLLYKTNDFIMDMSRGGGRLNWNGPDLHSGDIRFQSEDLTQQRPHALVSSYTGGNVGIGTTTPPQLAGPGGTALGYSTSTAHRVRPHCEWKPRLATLPLRPDGVVTVSAHTRAIGRWRGDRNTNCRSWARRQPGRGRTTSAEFELDDEQALPLPRGSTIAQTRLNL